MDNTGGNTGVGHCHDIRIKVIILVLREDMNRTAENVIDD
jgi:hypothetical protein